MRQLLDNRQIRIIVQNSPIEFKFDQGMMMAITKEERNARIATALTAAEASPDVMLRVEAVVAKTGVSRSGLYAMVANGRFPEPVRVGPRASRWRSGAVQQWIEQRQIDGARGTVGAVA